MKELLRKLFSFFSIVAASLVLAIIVSVSLMLSTFPGGAMVAQLAVNELVVGSNPTRGARDRPLSLRVSAFGGKGDYPGEQAIKIMSLLDHPLRLPVYALSYMVGSAQRGIVPPTKLDRGGPYGQMERR